MVNLKYRLILTVSHRIGLKVSFLVVGLFFFSQFIWTKVVFLKVVI